MSSVLSSRCVALLYAVSSKSDLSSHPPHLSLPQQNDNNTVIHFLLSTEIIPLCLRIMETGSELSKTVAIFIVQKILLDETGLTYICHTYERFFAVGTVLSNMVNQLVETQAVRLLKHVVRCYLRLSDNPRAREALRACLPEPLRDNTFAALLQVSYPWRTFIPLIVQGESYPHTGRHGHKTLSYHAPQQSQRPINVLSILCLLSSVLPFPPITLNPPVVATVPITYLRFAFYFCLDVCLGVNILPSRGTMY